jgi:hypothetical protein
MPNTNKYIGMDLVGQRHGMLTVIKKDPGSKSRWICRCDCGNTVTLMSSRFFKRQSCGCLEEENRRNIGERSKTHGMTNTILYSKYCSMKERCHNKNYIYYMRYGGRGIKICEEWENSFEAFVKWAYENGYDDTKVGYEQSLDRIDNDKDYCPENCRWVDQKTQVKNRSIATHIIYNGEDLNYVEFAEKYGIASEAFVRRHHERGQSPEDIINEWNDLHDDEYFSIGEASEYYGIPVNKLRQLAYTNKMDAIKVGFFWRFKKPQIA